jgi:fatty acyl-CoA reductase
VNLSRAVLPGFGAAAAKGGSRRRGLLLPLLSSGRRHGGGAVVACSTSSSSTTAGSSSSPPSSSFPAHDGLGSGDPAGDAGRIAVVEFLGAKNFLITGGTGFLAKGDT